MIAITLITFRIFKLNFKRENNQINLLSELWVPLYKFRCRNHKLPIEKFGPSSEDRNSRYCTLCHINEVGNEFHYVLKCPFFAERRMLLLGKRLFTHLLIFTINQVMIVSGTKLLKLPKLIQIIVKNVNWKDYSTGLNNVIYLFVFNFLDMPLFDVGLVN